MKQKTQSAFEKNENSNINLLGLLVGSTETEKYQEWFNELSENKSFLQISPEMFTDMFYWEMKENQPEMLKGKSLILDSSFQIDYSQEEKIEHNQKQTQQDLKIPQIDFFSFFQKSLTNAIENNKNPALQVEKQTSKFKSIRQNETPLFSFNNNQSQNIFNHENNIPGQNILANLFTNSFGNLVDKQKSHQNGNEQKMIKAIFQLAKNNIQQQNNLTLNKPNSNQLNYSKIHQNNKSKYYHSKRSLLIEQQTKSVQFVPSNNSKQSQQNLSYYNESFLINDDNKKVKSNTSLTDDIHFKPAQPQQKSNPSSYVQQSFVLNQFNQKSVNKEQENSSPGHFKPVSRSNLKGNLVDVSQLSISRRFSNESPRKQLKVSSKDPQTQSQKTQNQQMNQLIKTLLNMKKTSKVTKQEFTITPSEVPASQYQQLQAFQKIKSILTKLQPYQSEFKIKINGKNMEDLNQLEKLYIEDEQNFDVKSQISLFAESIQKKIVIQFMPNVQQRDKQAGKTKQKNQNQLSKNTHNLAISVPRDKRFRKLSENVTSKNQIQEPSLNSNLQNIPNHLDQLFQDKSSSLGKGIFTTIFNQVNNKTQNMIQSQLKTPGFNLNRFQNQNYRQISNRKSNSSSNGQKSIQKQLVQQILHLKNKVSILQSKLTSSSIFIEKRKQPVNKQFVLAQRQKSSSSKLYEDKSEDLRSTQRKNTQSINIQKIVEKVTLNVIDELKINNRINIDESQEYGSQNYKKYEHQSQKLTIGDVSDKYKSYQNYNKLEKQKYHSNRDFYSKDQVYKQITNSLLTTNGTQNKKNSEPQKKYALNLDCNSQRQPQDSSVKNVKIKKITTQESMSEHNKFVSCSQRSQLQKQPNHTFMNNHQVNQIELNKRKIKNQIIFKNINFSQIDSYEEIDSVLKPISKIVQRIPQFSQGPCKNQELFSIGNFIFQIFGVDKTIRQNILIEKFKSAIYFGINSKYNILWHFLEGKIYFGGWELNQQGQGQKSGEGVQYVQGKYIYSGSFFKGKKHGKGILKILDFRNLSIYVGDFCNNKRQGVGKSIEINGNVYEGEWFNNKRHGFGVFNHSKGQKYEGEFLNGDQHGLGIQYFKSGDSYQGYYKQNKFQGKGTYIWKTGAIYEGYFSKGKRNGKGIWRSTQDSSVQIYEGTYVDDKKNGYGIYRLPNGQIYQGPFKNDKKHGIGKTCLQNGKIIVSEWKQGKNVKKVEKQYETQASRKSNSKKYESLRHSSINFTKKQFQSISSHTNRTNQGPSYRNDFLSSSTSKFLQANQSCKTSKPKRSINRTSSHTTKKTPIQKHSIPLKLNTKPLHKPSHPQSHPFLNSQPFLINLPNKPTQPTNLKSKLNATINIYNL